MSTWLNLQFDLSNAKSQFTFRLPRALKAKHFGVFWSEDDINLSKTIVLVGLILIHRINFLDYFLFGAITFWKVILARLASSGNIGIIGGRCERYISTSKGLRAKGTQII